MHTSTVQDTTKALGTNRRTKPLVDSVLLHFPVLWVFTPIYSPNNGTDAGAGRFDRDFENAK
eukprot:4061641-Amphidinium_carterae.1